MITDLQEVYTLEFGQLLDQKDSKYDNYLKVYNKKHSFFDYERINYPSLEKAKKQSKN